MAKEVYRKDICFEGRVQGVGFRAGVVQVARGYMVTGIVKNMSDGRVFLQAEGDVVEVLAFLEEVRRQLGAFIRNEESHDSQGPARHAGFRIAL